MRYLKVAIESVVFSYTCTCGTELILDPNNEWSNHDAKCTVCGTSFDELRKVVTDYKCFLSVVANSTLGATINDGSRALKFRIPKPVRAETLKNLGGW
jgi:hypothetical protein